MKQQTNFKETEIGRIPEDWEVRRIGADRGGYWEVVGGLILNGKSAAGVM